MLFLPTELIRRIIESITDNPTLHSLLLVSPILNYEAERVIYRKVSPKGRENQEKLFQQLHGSRRVETLVRDLELDINDEEVSITDLPYWSSLSLALRTLINLKTVEIWYLDSGPDPQLATEQLFDGCLFQLENFSWPFPFGKKLLDFLENQRGIQKLCLFWPVPRNYLPPNALPQLSMLIGSTSVINALLPARQVTHLMWTSHLSAEEPDLVRIRRALNNIRVLHFDRGYPSPQLRTIMSYFGKLEVLEWYQTNYHEIIDNASLFSHLRQITLSFNQNMPPSREKVIERLFTSIPTLLLVDSWVESDTCVRWSRDSDKPEPILTPISNWAFC